MRDRRASGGSCSATPETPPAPSIHATESASPSATKSAIATSAIGRRRASSRSAPLQKPLRCTARAVKSPPATSSATTRFETAYGATRYSSRTRGSASV
jgi:hypothetical protein